MTPRACRLADPSTASRSMLAAVLLSLSTAVAVGQPLPDGRPSPTGAAFAPATMPLTASLPVTQPAPAPPSVPLSSGGTLTQGERLSVTQHQIICDGQPLQYRATAGDLVLRDDTGRARADFFFVAYDKLGGDPRTRPITFVFNGGPGAAAVWLHMGTAGPMRIAMPAPAPEQAPAPPYQLVPNEQTWLDVTDLVFIDPVGTGYSRAAAGQQAQEFYDVQQDVRSIGEFIRLYTTRYQRWLSPKLLAGESYGTTRAAALARFLQDSFSMDLNGVIMISTVLDFATLQPGPGNDLPYALYLPTYAATAWYHKRLPANLQQRDLPALLAEVQQWAMGEYRLALGRGAALPAPQRQVILQRLVRYTGLSRQFIDRADLRIDPAAFEAELLADERLLVGRFDSRMTGPNPQPLSRHPDYDPALAPYLGAYTAAFSDYVRRDLNYATDLQYEVLTGKVFPWNFGRQGNGYLYVGDDLRSAMVRAPGLKVLFASGQFDLATPYLAQQYTIEHLDLPPQLQGNLTQVRFPAGHMMYHQPDLRRQLKEQVAAVIRSATAGRVGPATGPGR